MNNQRIDRLIVASAHVRQVERAQPLPLRLPRVSSSLIYSIRSFEDSDDSDEESSNEEDRKVGVELASVERSVGEDHVDDSNDDSNEHIPSAPSTTTTTTTTSSSSFPPGVEIQGGGRRRTARRKRWSSSGGIDPPTQISLETNTTTASSTSCHVATTTSTTISSSPDDYSAVLKDISVQHILNEYWLSLCMQGGIDPHPPDKNDTKRIRFRIWSNFFRRLDNNLNDWNSEECKLLPGIDKNKLTFTNDEFQSFFFHDILAPRCAFALIPKLYVTYGKLLHYKIFTEASVQVMDSNSFGAAARYFPSGFSSSLSSSGSSSTTTASATTTPRGRRKFQQRQQQHHVSARSKRLAGGGGGGAASIGIRTQSIDGREEEKEREAVKVAGRELELTRSELIHSYVMLCPHDDLLELKNSDDRHQYTRKELDRVVRGHNAGHRHRLSFDCLSSDEKMLQRSMSRWSVTSNVSRMWVRAAIKAEERKETDGGGGGGGGPPRDGRTKGGGSGSNTEESEIPITNLESYRFGRDCSVMFQKQLESYKTKINKEIGMRSILEIMLSGKYTYRNEGNVINGAGAGSQMASQTINQDGQDGRGGDCGMWGITQMTFTMATDTTATTSSSSSFPLSEKMMGTKSRAQSQRSAARRRRRQQPMMRGSVIGHGIGLSDTTRCHYTLEGSFDWNRGDVVFVRRDGIGNSSSSSSSSSSSGRGSSSSSMVRRKRESETYIGQMIVLPWCLLLRCKPAPGGIGSGSTSTNSTKQQQHAFLLVTHFDQSCLSLKNLMKYISIKKKEEMMEEEKEKKIMRRRIVKKSPSRGGSRKERENNKKLRFMASLGSSLHGSRQSTTSSTTSTTSTTTTSSNLIDHLTPIRPLPSSDHQHSSGALAFVSLDSTVSYYDDASLDAMTPKPLRTVTAGSVEANLKAFAAAEQRAKSSHLQRRRRNQSTSASEDYDGLNSDGSRWKMKVTTKQQQQQQHSLSVSTGNNHLMLPLTRPGCVPSLRSSKRSTTSKAARRSKTAELQMSRGGSKKNKKNVSLMMMVSPPPSPRSMVHMRKRPGTTNGLRHGQQRHLRIASGGEHYDGRE